jgi:glycosyltransferase involved in cell wall biosynthesis
MSFIKPEGADPAPDMLVFEPEAEGHAFEWLAHVVHAAAADEACRISLVVAPRLRDPLVAQIPPGAGDRIRVFGLRRREERLCMNRRLLTSGFARWWFMRRYLLQTKAKSGFFLSIDHLSLPLALGLRAGGATIGGVLFRPSVHYRTIGPYRPSHGERLRDLRKSLLYRLMLLNGAVASVASLDPYFANFAVANYRHGRKVHAIADPVFPAADVAAGDRRLTERLPRDRVRFILFGSLQRRKGVLELLKALPLLDGRTGERVAVMIAGRIDDEVRADVVAGARHVAATRPDIWLHVEDRRLTSGEIEALVEGCDVILAPYQRFVGSSGVLLWAARAGKPVLTQDFGLLGRLVRDHGLGAVADVTDAGALAATLADFVRAGPQRHFDRQAAARFAAIRTPQAFSAAVLAGGDAPQTVSNNAAR